MNPTTHDRLLLHELAASATVREVLHPTQPIPRGFWGFPAASDQAAVLLSNGAMKAALWGPPHRLTLSLNKSDVFDRRWRQDPPVTLAELRAGAFAERNANRDWDHYFRGATSSRPAGVWLTPEGDGRERYPGYFMYPFPCAKPVGQVILQCDTFREAPPPEALTSLADGMVTVAQQVGPASLRCDTFVSATRNVLALNVATAGVPEPLHLRLYRHRDQAHRLYMNAEGTEIIETDHTRCYTTSQLGIRFEDWLRDRAWNGPIASPESGTDGRHFWIRQRLPADGTFPEGFEYVLMGVIVGGAYGVETASGARGLGTKPVQPLGTGTPWDGPDQPWIAEAPGCAATAVAEGGFTAFITIVTTADAGKGTGEDLLALARTRLAEAEALGFGGLRAENRQWYGALYDRRERGRVVVGGAVPDTAELERLFRSWSGLHGAGVLPDSRRYEADAHYVAFEHDAQPWHGLPCYNELFFTGSHVAGQSDRLEMYYTLVEHWLDACRKNAREVFGLPGMMLAHGYLPPVKATDYVHSITSLEFCMEIPAQVLKVLWDRWDYTADEPFLRRVAYPALRDLAIFYAAYLQPEPDGFLHVAPTVVAESWGLAFYQFKYCRDTTSALSMIKWTLRRAAEAADRLGVDAELAAECRAKADRLAPYPIVLMDGGPIFGCVPGIPSHQWAYNWFPGVYPTILADDITLDSPVALRDQMLRTVKRVSFWDKNEALVLLGACPDYTLTGTGEYGTEQRLPITTAGELERAVAAKPERLLNSRGGRLHLFPCVPAWADIEFRRFRARGGFAVSAKRTADGVAGVEIEAHRDLPCRLMNPWPGEVERIAILEDGRAIEWTVDASNGECLVFPAKQGASYSVIRR